MRALLLWTAFVLPAASAQPVLEADFAGRWVAAGETLRLRLPQALSARTHDLRVFAGTADLSALLRFPRPGVAEIDPRVARLAPGESEVSVFLAGAQWSELGRFPLKVLTPAGFEQSSFAPKLDVSNKSQFDSNTSGSNPPPARATFSDVTGRGGVSLQAKRGVFALDGNFTAVGSSYRNEALRYEQLAQRAPKADLAEYALRTRYGGTSLAIGHVSTGNNTLLLDGFASRGITVGQRIGQRFDVAFNALNGSSVVGYDNFLGVEEAEHRVYAVTAGFEFFAAQPGALRAEISLLDAAAQSRNNFNVGEVADAERSRGFGLRLTGRTAGNRLRGDVVFARSSFVNPFDAQLAQAGTLQPVNRSTANGRIVDLAFDLLQAAPLVSARHPLTFTLGLHHERVAPLYKSLGASFNADQQLNRVTLGTQIGAAQLQLAAARQEDNLDRVATILGNRTNSTSASLTLPLPQWTSPADGKSWWPALTYNWSGVHQRAVTVPRVEESGIAATHRPDQRNASHQFGLNVAREPWTWGYALAFSEQDNRQPGRENADFTTLGHQLNLGVRAWGVLALTVGLNRYRNRNAETGLVNYTTGGSSGLDLQLGQRWTLAANWSRTNGDDSRDLTQSRNDSAQCQLAYRFEVPSFGHRLPGQVFVRYARQNAAARDSTFGVATAGSQWAWDTGFSLSLF